MMARRYQSKDWDMIEAWCSARGTNFQRKDRLPKTGFLVDDVACCFLIKTDAKIGIAEYFISNPKVSSQFKMKAYDLIWAEIEKAAKKLNLDLLYGYTDIPKVAAILLRYQMLSSVNKPYFFFRKLLTNEETNGSDRNVSAPATGTI